MVQSEERQHLLDTFDPGLYEGVEDQVEVRPDYMNNYLVLSEETPELVPSGSNEFVSETMSDSSEFDSIPSDSNDFVSEMMPDFSEFDSSPSDSDDDDFVSVLMHELGELDL